MLGLVGSRLKRQGVALEKQRELKESYMSLLDTLGKIATVRAPFACPCAASAQSCTRACCCSR